MPLPSLCAACVGETRVEVSGAVFSVGVALALVFVPLTSVPVPAPAPASVGACPPAPDVEPTSMASVVAPGRDRKAPTGGEVKRAICLA